MPFTCEELAHTESTVLYLKHFNFAAFLCRKFLF